MTDLSHLRFLTDENFSGLIVKALKARFPALDLIRVQDTPTYTQQDIKVLELATQEGRILLKHDRAIGQHYTERLERGHPLPAIFIIDTKADLGRILEELSLVIEMDEVERYRGLIWYVPGL